MARVSPCLFYIDVEGRILFDTRQNIERYFEAVCHRFNIQGVQYHVLFNEFDPLDPAHSQADLVGLDIHRRHVFIVKKYLCVLREFKRYVNRKIKSFLMISFYLVCKF